MSNLAAWAKHNNSRYVALACLIEIVKKGHSLAELQPLLNQHEQSAWIRECVFGVCRWYYLLEQLSSKYLKKPLKAKDQDIQLIIFIGMYQLIFMRTSAHAAVNETVKLVNIIKKQWAKGLVNALLRKASDIAFEDSSESHQASFPAWMQQKFESDWPNSNDLFKWSNTKAPLCLRINSQKLSRAQYVAKLKQHNIAYKISEYLPHSIAITQSQDVSQLPGFEQGEFYIQDESAQKAALLLNIEPKMRVLDACSAPGGKSTYLAELSNNIHLTLIDKESSRIERMQENLKRLGHTATLLCADASEPQQWFDGSQFDRILLDAPCSASGIIRRHPDIKLLRKLSDIDDLTSTQAKLLKQLWPLLKTGGEMVYCTCSIFKEENEQQIQQFLATQPNAKEIKITDVPWGETRPYGIQVLPNQHGFDGFYYAKLRKIS